MFKTVAIEREQYINIQFTVGLSVWETSFSTPIYLPVSDLVSHVGLLFHHPIPWAFYPLFHVSDLTLALTLDPAMACLHLFAADSMLVSCVLDFSLTMSTLELKMTITVTKFWIYYLYFSPLYLFLTFLIIKEYTVTGLDYKI